MTINCFEFQQINFFEIISDIRVITNRDKYIPMIKVNEENILVLSIGLIFELTKINAFGKERSIISSKNEFYLVEIV